jgi:superfamily II DNA or RNA helicase
MTREDITKLALSKIDKAKYLILELATGVGKSRIAINLINHICERVFKNDGTCADILIVVAKTVHKKTWEDEINKWGGIKSDHITIECYESLKKYKNAHFDVVILDELQHLSDNRLDILDTINIYEACIGLSATIKKEMGDFFIRNYNAQIIKCGLREAIENDILPEPTIYLLPIELDTKKAVFKIKKFGKEIITTQRGYYNDLSSLVEWYKNKYLNTRNLRIKNLWLSTAGKRLKWLSEQKESIVLNILKSLKDYRTLTFCSSIEQSERLGKYNITSKNKESIKNLELFNNSKIKHITAVNILNECANLYNCRIGIFCNLNSSEIIVKQRNGRLLRHKSPIIIIPYYKNTREEELITKMLEEYNKDSVKIINNIKNIQL